MTTGNVPGPPGGSLWQGGGAYHAWAEFLQRWARAGQAGDPGLRSLPELPPLNREHFPGDAWERLGNRLTEALDERLQRWADALTRALSATAGEFDAGRALTQARSGLHAVRALVAHPALPQELRDRLGRMADDQVVRLQRTLEAQLETLPAWRADPRRAEARRRTLRDNPLTAVLTQPPPPPTAAGEAGDGGSAGAGGWDYDPAAPPRRRIIPT